VVGGQAGQADVVMADLQWLTLEMLGMIADRPDKIQDRWSGRVVAVAIFVLGGPLRFILKKLIGTILSATFVVKLFYFFLKKKGGVIIPVL